MGLVSKSLAHACPAVTAGVPISLALLAQVVLAAKLQPRAAQHRQEKHRLLIQGKPVTPVINLPFLLKSLKAVQF